MANITDAHLAQLLVGFARTQRAVVNGLTNNDPSKLQPVISSLQTAAGIHQQGKPTLLDMPARVLLQIVGGGHPQNLDAWIAEELHRLTE